MLSADEVAKVVSEVTGRIIERVTLRSLEAGGRTLAEIINETLWWEQDRLADSDPSDEDALADKQFYAEIRRQLPRVSEAERARLLERIVHRYADEIAGNFNPTVYKLAATVGPPMLSALLTGLSPKRLFDREAIPRLDKHVIVEGDIADLGRLRDRGTLIVTPTHSSNLDSLVIGYAVHELGLPPLTYGAGLNLFRNPIVGRFMHNLGAYTVDRRKRDPLYKQTLKQYATVALEFGQDNLFFPGGTRSRSGALERHLKKGLLGCSVAAYRNNLIRRRPKPDIYIIPCTILVPARARGLDLDRGLVGRGRQVSLHHRRRRVLALGAVARLPARDAVARPQDPHPVRPAPRSVRQRGRRRRRVGRPSRPSRSTRAATSKSAASWSRTRSATPNTPACSSSGSSPNSRPRT